MPDEKKCFVIMPITTPGPMVQKYHDGKDHFHHVYHCLFEPSIRKAGYTPIPPKAEGSDVIHAGIIGNLESVDLVLCDMSCLNPNVFFEWGIRTALNRPVCIVKDELSEDVPFDTTMLNYSLYSNALHVWEIEAEREKLTAHLTASATKAGNENALWKYFGLSSKGQPYQAKEGIDGKLDYIAMQIESLGRKMDSMDDRIHARKRDPIQIQSSLEVVHDVVSTLLQSGSGRDFKVFSGLTPDGVRSVLIRPDPTWDEATKVELADAVATTLAMPVNFVRQTPDELLEDVHPEKGA